MMKLHVYPSVAEVVATLADWISDYITDTLQKQERFTFCLAGGSTPKDLYHILAMRYSDSIEWERVHFFWGDERYVPYHDERNNARLAIDAFLCHTDVPDSQVHRMNTGVDENTAVDEYQKILETYFKESQHSFDLILLGLGNDGHTLSLFPTNNNEFSTWTASVRGPETLRLTLTPEIVNRSKQVVFLVAGDEKAEKVAAVINGPADPVRLPAQLIKPANGDVHWFLDAAAAKDYRG
ncbi:6-phosphogluconolactonase [Segetibacter sp. 3557_3]|uniref:6-phosphogluconolactonase n=1 Tax=Segetibacter sp. 3557_3 TaxID=2547429 RepID=UPI0010588BA3|nr:6-phosphogluconolactonase [Segetibacter sp. 3557_3]TDH18340.1 6-phosphogluconolactonase [Segetibacter sp. 3557_3]